MRSMPVLTVESGSPGRIALGLVGRAAYTLVAAALFALAACSTVTPPPPPVTVPQIVAMSKAGEKPGAIIDKIHESHTVYRLTASQLADLESQGVAPSVIDYMQQTLISAIQREQARADWRYWSLDGDGYWYGGCPYGWGPRWCY